MGKPRTVISHLCQKTQQPDCDVQFQFTRTHLVPSSYSRYHQLNTHAIARVHYSKQVRPILTVGVVSMTTTCIPCLSHNILLKLTFPYKQTSCVIQFLDYSGFSNGKVSFTDDINLLFSESQTIALTACVVSLVDFSESQTHVKENCCKTVQQRIISRSNFFSHTYLHLHNHFRF